MKRIAMPLLAAMLAGCSYSGGVGDPVVRKFSWFSFVEGGDLRAGCVPGAPSRYRMVYTGVYDEQRRIYELGDGADPMRLTVLVIGEPDLTQGLNVFDPQGPWRGHSAEIRLDPAQRRLLVARLADSGAFGRPDIGLELPSRGFHWTVAACHDGRYSFAGWLWPQEGFQRLSFPPLLFGLDPTGVAPNAPRAVPPRYKDTQFHGDFSLRIGERGLAGTP